MLKLLLKILFLSPISQCLPTLLVATGTEFGNKCLQLEATRDAVLRILYNAPDLSDTDKAFISVNVRPAARVIDTKLHAAPILSRLKPSHLQLSDRMGNFTHTVEVDGTASVCINWESSNVEMQRIGIRVVHDASTRGRFLESSLDVNHHLSHMEAEFQRLGMGMNGVLSEADMAKERDSVFHRQAQDMDQATIFWPVVQVCVLLMTGFAQASHIVRFFKSRRII